VLGSDDVVLLVEMEAMLLDVLGEAEIVVEVRLLFVAYGMLKPEDGASVEATSSVLEAVAVVLFWYAAWAVSVGAATSPVPMRVLEDCETRDVVLFCCTELSMVLETVLETVDTTLEFAALLLGDTNAAWAVLLAQTEESSDVIAVDKPAKGAVVEAESELDDRLVIATVELLAETLICDDVVG
jgi:hypothetical protein